MKNKLTYNWHLKLLSLMMAFILWLVVVNMNDPDITKKIYNIPIEILNEEKITSQGEGQVYEVEYPVNKTAVATFKGARSIMDNLKAGDIKATVDFSDVSSVGAVKINFSIPDGITLVDATTENMRIVIEPLETKTFQVEFQALGMPASGFVLGDVRVSPNVIKVKAPQSILENIKHVIVEADIEGLSTDLTNASAKVKLLDGNGKIVNYDENTDITVNKETILVNAVMLKTQEIPVYMEVTGTVAEGYRYRGIKYDPNKITLKGTKEKMAQLSSITVSNEEALTIDGLAQGKEVKIDITKYLPDGISLLDENQRYITAHLYVEPLYTKNIEIPADSLTVLNKPENMLISYGSNTITAEIQGIKSDLEEINTESLNPTIDLKGLGIGVHICPVIINISDDVKVLNKLTFTVTITEKVPETTSPAESETNTEMSPTADSSVNTTANTAEGETTSDFTKQTSVIPADVKPTDTKSETSSVGLESNTTLESTENLTEG